MPTVRRALQKPDSVLSPILWPGSGARSRRTMRVSGRRSFSIEAYSAPIGPAPITTTSQRSLMVTSLVHETLGERPEERQERHREAGGGGRLHQGPAQPAQGVRRPRPQGLEAGEDRAERGRVVAPLRAAG